MFLKKKRGLFKEAYQILLGEAAGFGQCELLGVVFRVVVLAAPLEVLHLAHLTLLVLPLND